MNHHRARAVIIILVLGGLAFLAWRLLAGDREAPTLSGYIEGETLFLAAPVAGTVTSIAAVEGQRVAPGLPLFTIDPATLSAEGEQARARVAEDCERNKWLNAQEMLEYGLVDSVLQRLPSRAEA